MTVRRVLVTGAGGAAGVAVIRSLLRRADVEVFAADMDGWAAALYLVPAERRRLVPPGLRADFVDEVRRICREDRVDVLFSTVDVELLPLALRRDELAADGTVLAAPSTATLGTALDKHALAVACAPHTRVPTTTLLDAEGKARAWDFPVIVKPRRGAGSRGIHLVPDREALEALPDDAAQLIQEHLPGDEYSVDVLAGADGEVVAAVPRSRARVDSGVSIAGRTIRDAGLEGTAAAVARAIGLVGVANVQLRRDTAGTPALLEVNARFPGAMPLTVAAGVDMPSLALDLALGLPLPATVEFREVANVRFLEDLFLAPDEVLTGGVAAEGDA